MNRIFRGERGMVSLFGLCALGILMIVSATMYAVSRNHISSARRFLARDALRNAAEDGVRLAVAQMNASTTAADKANGATDKKESLITAKVGDASVEVFARKNGSEILLLGVSQKGEKGKDEERARVVAVVKENAGKYAIEHWER